MVAFVAYSEAFGIGSIFAADSDSVFRSPSTGYMILDDVERGR